MLAGLLAAAVLGPGCAKKAAPATEAPADASMAADDAEGAEAGADWEGEVLGDPLARASSELEQYEDSMLAEGIELPEPVQQTRTDAGLSVTATPAAEDDAGRCTRICELATNICTLADRICALSDEHTGQERYASVCERATLDCERATAACEGCDG